MYMLDIDNKNHQSQEGQEARDEGYDMFSRGEQEKIIRGASN